MSAEEKAQGQGLALDDGSLLDQTLAETKMSAKDEGYAIAKKGVSAFIAEMMAPKHAGEKVDKSVVDSMIAEMVKMTLLREIFGEEGKDWECGTRLYLQGSIQSQEIVFKDGRPPVTFYTDFSKFGAF